MMARRGPRLPSGARGPRRCFIRLKRLPAALLGGDLAAHAGALVLVVGEAAAVVARVAALVGLAVARVVAAADGRGVGALAEAPGALRATVAQRRRLRVVLAQ